jgi:IclR family acetate operon transcriptional repressor
MTQTTMTRGSSSPEPARLRTKSATKDRKAALQTTSVPASGADDAIHDAPLVRARRVLEVVYEATRPLSSLEIARRCDLDPSSAHRLVQNLAASGFLLREEESKRYLPHPRMLFPFPIYHPWELVRRDAGTVVRPLRDRLLITTGFVVFYFGSRILLELAPGSDPLSPSYRTVLTSPLHASGSGKMLLMQYAQEERRELLGPGPFEAFTPRTLVDHDGLNADLDQARRLGYVTAVDDYIMGFRVVAAPITIEDQMVGCLFCSGGSTVLPDERVEQVGQEVQRAAMLFSRATPNLRLLSQLLGTDGTTRAEQLREES